jgi:zinc protease
VVGVSDVVQRRVEGRAEGQDRFCALFEHLMFNGSENLPGDFFEYLQQIGATDYNGTTNFDRTNYFQTVPTGALERALFMESTGWATCSARSPRKSSITSAASSRTRSARATTSRAGSSSTKCSNNLFPQGHPYRHSPIGSMADLDAASLNDVQDMVPRQIWAEQCGAGARRRHRCRHRQAAGREIFRRNRARAGQRPSGGRQCRPWPRPSPA